MSDLTQERLVKRHHPIRLGVLEDVAQQLNRRQRLVDDAELFRRADRLVVAHIQAG